MTISIRSISILVVVAVLLTLLFWGPLWWGYGFIGGDLYPYFFPQKAFLTDRLHAGEFPLWNNLTGFGYPILGESQTGAAYPPYVLAYYFLNINTAYNVQHLLHYVLCFLGAWLFARRLGLSTAGSILTAITFTYGWFPPRACLEWAIVTGAWLPWALWCVESFIQTRWWRYAMGLSTVLGLQLLAGHFHLAFITVLLVVSYGTWRTLGDRRTSGTPAQTVTTSHRPSSLLIVTLVMSIAAGFLIAAVQLVPAWELKTRSSRATVGGEHEPSYGHLPPLYASQMITPWMWYSPLAIDGEETIRTITEFAAPWHWFGPHRDLDESLMQSRAGGLTNVSTNKVEAHLYCGLVPLGLAVWWFFLSQRASSLPNSLLVLPRSEAWFWVIAGSLALVYATGWLLPVARFIPGFNFFRGPGRYGIVTTLAVAILAGRGLDRLVAQRALFARTALLCCVYWSTIGDLWLVSRMVTYAVMVSRPPITVRDQSPIRKLLLEEKQLPRLYAPGQNLGNLLGVSCLPVYLGIAPAEYSGRKFAGDGMPKSDASRPLAADAEFSTWLRDSGVTHILSFQPLDESSWKASQIWQGIDPLLNSAWGRQEPLFLYRLRDSLGRASALDGDSTAIVQVPAQRDANQLAVEVQSARQTKVVLRELEYPGWTLEIDGQPMADASHGMFREASITQGSHKLIWRYQPVSVKIGLAITLATVLVLAAIGHVRFWHREWLDGRIATLFARNTAKLPDQN